MDFFQPCRVVLKLTEMQGLSGDVITLFFMYKVNRDEIIFLPSRETQTNVKSIYIKANICVYVCVYALYAFRNRQRDPDQTQGDPRRILHM